MHDADQSPTIGIKHAAGHVAEATLWGCGLALHEQIHVMLLDFGL